jgi:hypothetical protein
MEAMQDTQEELSGPMRVCAALPKLVQKGMIHIVI